MAGGKLSPRQKMINLMYLVFIALIAMQMDKKVLSSFGFMKEKVEDANNASSANIKHILESLEIKANDQPDKFADFLGYTLETTNSGQSSACRQATRSWTNHEVSKASYNKL